MLLRVTQSANLAVRFLLELSALAALGYWGAQTGGSLALRIALAIAAPVAAAVVWGTYGAPAAPLRLRRPGRLALEAVIFGLAALGLAAGHPHLAITFLTAVLANDLLLFAWRQA
jgi:hypothetical protein